MKRFLVLGILFLAPPFAKPFLLRLLAGAEVDRTANIGWFSAIDARHITMRQGSAIRPLTIVALDGDLFLGRDAELSSFCLVYGSSSFSLGERSYVGPQSLINADEEVRIGVNSALGPRCMVFTHGSFLSYLEGYWVRLAGVTIGDRVWCAAGVFIHPGTEVGDDCFVNSRTVLSQSIPADSVVEGNPGRIIQSMSAVRRKMTPRRVDAALSQILHDFDRIALRRELGIAESRLERLQVEFRYRGKRYRIRVIPSQVNHAEEAGTAEGVGRDNAPLQTRDDELVQIFVVNNPEWVPLERAIVLSVQELTVSRTEDPIVATLVRFARRFYGVRFSTID